MEDMVDCGYTDNIKSPPLVRMIPRGLTGTCLLATTLVLLIYYLFSDV